MGVLVLNEWYLFAWREHAINNATVLFKPAQANQKK